MTPLEGRILDLVEASGPIPVADYMALCLLDPQHGYYTRREPFGAAGDFVTAPEISQMFGELVGVWLYSAWQALGAPMPVTVAEFGPGRGTLFRDMLRAQAAIDADFVAGATYSLIEASPRLREAQRRTLAGSGVEPSWHDGVGDLPTQPLLAVGNEIFDALPVHQYIRTGRGWSERCVARAEAGGLAFVAGAGSADPALLPPGAADAPPGAIAELSPARSAMMEAIGAFLAGNGGAGLFVDYGYGEPGLGDTLQAVRGHRYEDVLASPGEADLTAHVDFAALRSAAAAHGLESGLLDQGTFLLEMGLLERAGSLGRNADQAARARIEADVRRLADPREMGELFKVLAILPPGTAVHPFGKPD